MAEKSVKMRNAKRFGKKRHLIRFPPNSVNTWSQRHALLRRATDRVRFGQRLWSSVAPEESDESHDANDFEGFDQSVDASHDDDDSDVTTTQPTTTTTTTDTNRIQELLRSQWEDRIRALAAAPPKPPPILRKARLQIGPQTIARIRGAHRSPNKSGQPGVITCAICAAVKYYSHVQRRYGVFSCEPCSKFFARFLKQPKQYFCGRDGDCAVGDASSTRCRACWLKVCLQKFRHESRDFAPKLRSPPNVALITVDTGTTARQATPTQAAPLLMVARGSTRGPRVKRVCRAGPRRPPPATFGDGDSDSDALPVDVYLCRAFEHKKTFRQTVA